MSVITTFISIIAGRLVGGFVVIFSVTVVVFVTIRFVTVRTVTISAVTVFRRTENGFVKSVEQNVTFSGPFGIAKVLDVFYDFFDVVVKFLLVVGLVEGHQITGNAASTRLTHSNISFTITSLKYVKRKIPAKTLNIKRFNFYHRRKIL